MALNGFDVANLTPEVEAGAGTRTPGESLGRALSLTVGGRFELALAEVDDALESVEGWGEELPTVAVLLRMTRGWAQVLAGRPVEAELEADAQYRAAVRSHAAYPIAAWCFARGLVAVLRGTPATAITAMLEANAAHGGSDRGFVRPTRAYLAMAFAAAGRTEDARATLDAADGANRSLDRLFGAEVVRADAWVRASANELSFARDEALRAAEMARASEQPALETLALHDVARFGGAALAVDRLTALAGEVDGFLVPLLAGHARGLAYDDGEALTTVSSGLEQLGFVLFAAEAASAAVHAYRSAGGTRVRRRRGCGPPSCPRSARPRAHPACASPPRPRISRPVSVRWRSSRQWGARVGTSPTSSGSRSGRSTTSSVACT